MITTTACRIPARLLDAQSRLDDGHPQPGDRDRAELLDRLIHQSAWQIVDAEYQRDVERYEAWHSEVCDGENCRHYESKEEN